MNSEVRRQHKKKLMLTLGITLSVMIIQLVGALLSHSTALLADTAHMFTDSLGLTLALAATFYAGRPGPTQRTYGNVRVEVLSAGVNGLVVLGIGLFVIYRGIQAVMHPGEVIATVMLIGASLGLIANITGLFLLRKARHESLNLQGAYLEVLGDMLGSVAVILASLIILITGWLPIDGIISILIGLMIVPRALALLKDVVTVLMESTPKNIDTNEVRQHLKKFEEVIGVHDLHIWTISSGNHAMTTHLVVSADEPHPERVLPKVQACLDDHFDLQHATIQIEPEGSQAHRTCEYAHH